MDSITSGHLRLGLGHLSNANSNCFSPLKTPLQGETTQTTAPMSLHNGGSGTLDASETSNMTEFEVATDEFETTQDGFETKATIGGLYFIFFDIWIRLTMMKMMEE